MEVCYKAAYSWRYNGCLPGFGARDNGRNVLSNKLARQRGNSPVRYKIAGPIDKPTALYLGVDYEEAPVPQNYYVADYYRLEEQDLTVTITFGKIDSAEKGLRSKVEIVFPAITFVAQLWASSRDFHKTLARFVADVGSQAASPGERMRVLGDKVHTAQANNVLMLISGGECLMDFFYISPKEIWSKPRKGGEIDLEAVVRIIIPANLLLGFLDSCEAIVEPMKKRFASQLKEEPHGNDLELT